MQSTSRIVVIGGGPAGREAAERAAHLRRADVTLVTDDLDPHGRLDQTAIRFLAMEAGRAAQAWAPERPTPGSRYAAAMRETIISALRIAETNFRSRMAGLRDVGVQIVEGKGSLAASDAVTVSRPQGRLDYPNCRGIILAPGTEPIHGLDPESRCVITPRAMSSLVEIPDSLIVLGSSPAALELAAFFSAYGVFITVVGARRPALDFLDRDLRDNVVHIAADDNIRILTDVTAVAGMTDGRADLLLSDGSHVDADCVLPCADGDCRTEGLGLEGPGVHLGTDGEIVTDERMQTNIPEIFAAGSVTGCLSLNVALKQAETAAENALGGESSVNYDIIPAAARSNPEIGAVGLTEERAERSGIPVSAMVVGTGLGVERWAKVVADGSSGRTLGLHAVGDGAVEAAHMGALAIHAGITLNDIADLSCVDGTMAESISAAAYRGRQPLPEVVRPIVTGPD